MSKQPRRKGNAKAASSSHAAELLATYGTSGTIGFDGVFANVFEAASEVDEYQALDSDVVLILKKLSKKDPKTREKALRELQEVLITKDIEIVDASFGHFATIQDKLLTDGSPTVRHLCCRVIASSVLKLKKLSEKHLKKVIPFLLLASCDVSNSVRSAAESFMNECMPGDKQEKVTTLFANETANLALEIICGRSLLCQQQKYDDEETAEQRSLRLTLQCLTILAKLGSTVKSEKSPELFATIQRMLFSDIAVMKRLLKSNSPIQSALLNVAMQCPNFSELVINSPLAIFVISNIGSQDSSVNSACFHAFMKLSESEEYFHKVDVKSTIVPKFLSLIRNKSGHWSHLAPFLLNGFSIILDKLSVEDQAQYALRLLDAFSDNLPFEQTFLYSFWSKAYTECAKLTLCRIPSVLSNILTQFLPLLDFVFTESVETQSNMVSFLCWLADKDHLKDQVFLKSLELNAFNKLPSSRRFISLLLTSCKDAFIDFHARVLRCIHPLSIDFVQPLIACSDGYFLAIDKAVDLLSLLTTASSNYTLADSIIAAEVVLRKVVSSDPNSIRLIFDNMYESKLLYQSIVAVAAEKSLNDVWHHLTDARGGIDAFADCCSVFIDEWMQNNDVNSVACIVSRFEADLNERVLERALQNKKIQPVTWLLLLDQIKVTTQCRAAISSLLLTHLLVSTSIQEDHQHVIFQYLSTNIPTNLHLYLIDIFRMEEHIEMSNMHSLVWRLIGLNRKYEELLISSEFLRHMIAVYDDNVASFEVPYLLGFGFSSTSSEHMVNRNLLDNELDVYEKFAGLVKQIDLSGLSDDCHQKCATFLQLLNVIHFIQSKRSIYGLVSADLAQESVSAKSKKLAMDELLTLQHSPLVLATLRHLRDDADEFLDLSASQQTADLISALRLPSCGSFSAPELFIMRYHNEYSSQPLEFLRILREFIRINQTSWETELFDISADNDLLKLSCVWMQAATQYLASVASDVDEDISDFLLCGLVTALDSVDATSSEKNLIYTSLQSTFIANTLDLFIECDKLATKLPSESSKFSKEWNEFFLPTLSRIIVRLFALLTAEADCKPSVRSLCLAIQSISTVPDDLGLRETYLPELDTLRYEPSLQTLISSTVHLLQSHELSIAFSALHMLNKMSGLLYRHENSEWNEDEDKISKEPRKAKIPFVLNKLITGKLGLPSLMAYDAAFEPFLIITNEEERVSYCNTLGLYFDLIIDNLLSECEPLENMSKSRYSGFFGNNNFCLSDCASDDEFRVRYACTLFYRMVSSLPAVFRSWYNGLKTSNTAAIMKLVRQYCSVKIIETELTRIKEANVVRKAEKDKSLKVMVVPHAREVVSEYTVEETTMKLTISLPVEYPLVVPAIQLDKSIVASEKSKKWLLQLTAYLFHQNGSTMDGILMWRKNVDKDVDGAEACCICMMTIHSNSHQLPRVKCKQCKNKFHSNCLYKWFESSNQSSCPLCRANFT